MQLETQCTENGQDELDPAGLREGLVGVLTGDTPLLLHSGIIEAHGRQAEAKEWNSPEQMSTSRH
jgi:hypothetical protein